MTTLHPFDPVTPGEITLTSSILQHALSEAPLRFRRIDLQDPVKKDVLPFLEAERLGQPLPSPPPRILQVLFDNEKSGTLCKALVNATSRSVVYVKELPKHVQVRTCSTLSFI
jgi:primary-amine oxidase